MVNWKVSGVVEDSEDDDDETFDSQEPNLPLTTSKPNEHDNDIAPGADYDSIWDVPNSPAEQQTTATRPHQLPQTPIKSTATATATATSPDSSPLSSAPDTDELAESPSHYRGTENEPHHVRRVVADFPDRGDSPDPLDTEQDDVSESYVRLTEPTPDFLLEEEPTDDPLLRLSSSPASPLRPSPSPSHPDLVHVGESNSAVVNDAMRAAAWRYERSLRPRKPIQEHPYLLESAQYSSALKSHGVRPLRLALQEAASRRSRAQQDDSQDTEFQDDSQNLMEEGLGEDSGESQSLEDDRAASLTFPPSSSEPRLSSPKHQGLPSSPRSLGRSTDATSPLVDAIAGGRGGNEEFPSLEDLLRERRQARIKRPTSPEEPSERKKRRCPAEKGPIAPSDYFDIASDRFLQPLPLEPSTSGLTLQQMGLASQDQNTIARSGEEHTGLSVEIERRQVSPTHDDHFIDLTMDYAPLAGGGDGGPNPLGESESENDNRSDDDQGDVLRYGRRARGVLPASHFRLDRPNVRHNSRRDAREHQIGEPCDPMPKRGVAVRRTAPSRLRTLSAFSLDDFSDAEDSEAETERRSKSVRGIQNPPALLDIEHEDDADSVVEDNSVDNMLAPRKRRPNRSESPRDSTPSRPPAASFTRHEKRRRQPKITGHLIGMTKPAHTGKPSAPRLSSSARGPGQPRQQRVRSRTSTRPTRAHRLGILDVIEPQAPRFLKIAARTVKRKSQKGRSSPRHKSINLSTRQDQMDAGSVLQDWRNGKIQPRASVNWDGPATSRPALKPMSHNTYTNPTSALYKGSPGSSSATFTPTKATSNAGGEAAKTPTPQPRIQVRCVQPGTHRAAARPANLEDDQRGQPSRLAFRQKKNLLDSLYRGAARQQALPSDVDTPLSTSQDARDLSHPLPSVPEAVLHERPKKPEQRRRFRKSTVPRHVDTAAAQYRHANDPLPSSLPSPVEPEVVDPDDSLLRGLGPFGTHYTQHFEVFPLPAGVFFHEDTLVGSGRVEVSTDAGFAERIQQPRARVFFSLSGQTLRWGPWNDEVSSELGILVDQVLHQLCRADHSEGEELDTTAAARYVCTYVQDSLSISEEAEALSFLLRLQDCLGSFVKRLEADVNRLGPHECSRAVAALSHFVIVAVCGLNLCESVSSLAQARTGMEELLRMLMTNCVACLLRRGVGILTELYNNLQTLEFRERGLRSDCVEAQAWVILMNTLKHLRIPRLGFWDVIYSVLITLQDRTTSHVSRFEELWRTVFTLLPLGEFDSSGVILPGSRHRLSMDGWALPQLVLRRVFQLYKANDRQAPSFNDYCKALVGRCHYLVEQWGWYNCAATIGTIFDFFASKNLSHFRNEEAYQSPEFLEKLHLEPSLQVQPGDRCFHIFLKLVALTIRQWGRPGSDKEIRNLVFRILPNHNRQYLKEQNVHHHDLAALRNHHDLLCTLYWAAPAVHRPQIQQLEKLVIAASSHKEACFINLRAWNQLSRFVVAKETSAAFLPFSKWQSSVFHQLLDQYDSVAADIQQQFQEMSRDCGKEITSELKNAIIASNKASTAEVLRFCVTVSLDTVHYARTPELAILAGNIVQLQQACRRFSTSTPELPWNMLRDALTTIESCLDIIEPRLPPSQSQQERDADLDDCVMLLDHSLTADFFSMAQSMVGHPGDDAESNTSAVARAECTRQVVIVAGKMAAVLARCGTMRVLQCFKPGKYCLCNGPPIELSLHQKQYLPLFFAVIQQRYPSELADIGSSTVELWLLSLVKPRRYMAFVNEFAVSLLGASAQFVPSYAAVTSIPPNYDHSRNLFEYALNWMRRTQQGASAAERKTHLSTFSSALRATMKQIERDLLSSSIDALEHPAYVNFVRRIISLIKSHGAGICAVTGFFYKISREYAPPAQDPQLQVAQIRSYGIRLEEGDLRIAPQLFSFLFHNFKQALLNDKLGNEVLMLQKGMRSNAILAFILGKMLPAILKASLSRTATFVMLDVFSEAIRLRLTKSATPQGLSEEALDAISLFAESLIDWVTETQSSHEIFLSAAQIHIFGKALSLLDVFQPSLEAASFSTETNRRWPDLERALEKIARITISAEAFLNAEQSSAGYQDLSHWDLFSACATVQGGKGAQDAQIAAFANELVNDIQKNWIITSDSISVQAPARAPSLQPTQSGQGSSMPIWDMQEMINSLHGQLRLRNGRWMRCRRRPAETSDEHREQSVLM